MTCRPRLAHRPRRLIAFAVVLIAAVLPSACGRESSTVGPSDSSLPAGAPIVVVGSFPQSGPLSGADEAGRGFAAFIAKVNARGGVHGHRLTYVEYDDGYDPARMAANARRAVTQDKAKIFVSFGAPSEAVRPYLNQNKVFHLALAGSSPLSDTRRFPYTHAWFPDISWEAAVDAAYVKVHLPDVKLGILGANTDIPDSAAAGARRVGVPPALVLKVPPAQVDVRAQVVQLKAAGVNAVMLVGNPAQIINAVTTMRAFAYAPEILVNSVTAGRKDTIDPLGGSAIGLRTALWAADPADPLWHAQAHFAVFRADLAANGRAKDADAVLAMFGYIASEALINALATADVVRPDRINAAWNATKNLIVPGLPPGASLDAVGDTGRLVHVFHLVRFDGSSWRPLDSAVDALAAGYTRGP